MLVLYTIIWENPVRKTSLALFVPLPKIINIYLKLFKND